MIHPCRYFPCKIPSLLLPIFSPEALPHSRWWSWRGRILLRRSSLSVWSRPLCSILHRINLGHSVTVVVHRWASWIVDRRRHVVHGVSVWRLLIIHVRRLRICVAGVDCRKHTPRYEPLFITQVSSNRCECRFGGNLLCGMPRA